MLTACTSSSFIGRGPVDVRKQLGDLLRSLAGIGADHLRQPRRGRRLDLTALLHGLLHDPAGHLPRRGQRKTFETQAGLLDPFHQPVLVVVLFPARPCCDSSFSSTCSVITSLAVGGTLPTNC